MASMGWEWSGEVAIIGSAEINAENLFNGAQNSSPQSQSLYC